VRIGIVAVVAAAAAYAPGVPAQQYPAKTVRMIVPLAAGSGTDQVSRVLAQKLGEQLGQQVIVENRPGAGATIGTEAAAKAAPDGYTLYMGGSVALTISPALYRRVSYEASRDFTPVSLAQQATKTGKLRLLGITSEKRIAPLPDVPPIADTVPAFEWSGWQVLMVPAATPQDVVKRLQNAAQDATRNPDFRGHLEREGSEPFSFAPEQFPQFLREQIARNARLVALSGARVD
jgi:tripartite-type tricarboxylate transporter receptor subunit TctC